MLRWEREEVGSAPITEKVKAEAKEVDSCCDRGGRGSADMVPMAMTEAGVWLGVEEREEEVVVLEIEEVQSFLYIAITIVEEEMKRKMVDKKKENEEENKCNTKKLVESTGEEDNNEDKGCDVRGDRKEVLDAC